MEFLKSLSEVFNFSTNQVVPLLATVTLAFFIGLFVYLIYRLTFSGVIYSKTFNMSLVMLTMVSAMVILFMSNNLKLSLGMVGALSIVRFRTAIKDPIDTVFMFWAIGEGIALGAGFILAAIIGAILIVLSAALMVYVIMSIGQYMPQTGPWIGKITQYHAPDRTHGLVMVLTGTASLASFVVGIILVASRRR